MRKIITTLFILYVVINGSDILGTLSASSRTIRDWSDYTLIEVDESFRGKQGYQIRYDGVKVRHATKAEIATYLQQQEAQQEVVKKQRAMDTLGISEKNLIELKKLGAL